MGYITSSWGRPLQGVSQQPDRVRLEGQCTLQENMTPDVVRGLVRRASTNNIGKVRVALPSFNSKWHSYDRGSEQYIMMLEPNSDSIEVYNLKGERQIVNGTSDYIRNNLPNQNIVFQTIGDYTFINNRTTRVLMDQSKTAGIKQEGVVYLQYATYGRTYSISLNGQIVATKTTPDGTDAKNSLAVQTQYLAEILYTQIMGGTVHGIGGDPDPLTYPKLEGWYAELHGNVIYIRREDNGAFTMSTSDAAGGKDFVTVKGTVKDVTSLPPWAPDGYVIRVTGSGNSNKDDYWLKATYPNSETAIRWVEAPAPDSLYKFNKSTMPHVLVRDSISSGVATFTLREGEWEDREVGSDANNPIPSFIDQDNPQTIENIGLFQNRLFILSGENFTASRSNFFFNFFRESAKAAVDTDPLDGYADTDKVSTLRTYQMMDGDLLLFADDAQFSIKGSEPVTKLNLTLRPVTAYPSNTYIKPQAGGENIFFAINNSGYTGVREMFTDNYLDTKKAQPITDYVNTYLVGNCELMLANANFNTLFIRTDSNRKRVYTYDWLWQGDQKVQSAWGTFIFDDDIHYFAYFGDYLYLCAAHYGELFMERINMFNDPIDLPLTYPICLDRKVSITANFNNTTGKWDWQLPYPMPQGAEPVFVISSGGKSALMGSDARWLRSGDTFSSTEKLADNNGSVTLIAGIRYMSKWTPSQPIVKDVRDRVIGLSSIIISQIFVNYEDAGHLQAYVSDKYGRAYTYTFDGRVLGQSGNKVGYADLSSGQYRFPVGNRAEDATYTIQSNHHTPMTIRDMEMSGTFNQRGQRI